MMKLIEDMTDAELAAHREHVERYYQERLAKARASIKALRGSGIDIPDTGAKS